MEHSFLYEFVKYPFLYKLRKKHNNVIVDCIEASLSTSYFLHFAGSWYESYMWFHKKIYNTKSKIESNKKFKEFLDTKITAKPTIRFLPKYFIDLEKSFMNGAIHPGDIKKYLISKLNDYLTPVREHFENNENARQFLKIVKKNLT